MNDESSTRIHFQFSCDVKIFLKVNVHIFLLETICIEEHLGKLQVKQKTHVSL